MDSYGVPKNVNRIVLNALYSMKDLGLPSPTFSDICDFVENSAGSSLQCKYLPSLVRRSLKNMTELGVISRNTMKYSARDLTNPSTSKKISPNIFRTKVVRNERSKLDPNMKRRHSGSDDSMLGTELNKVRKRFRANNPIKRQGKSTVLPKVRKSQREIALNARGDQCCFFQEDYFTDDEVDWKSSSSMDMEPELYDKSDTESTPHKKSTQVTQTESNQAQEKKDPEEVQKTAEPPHTKPSRTNVVDDKSESVNLPGQSEKVVRTESQVKTRRMNQENEQKQDPCPSGSKDGVVTDTSYIA